MVKVLFYSIFYIGNHDRNVVFYLFYVFLAIPVRFVYHRCGVGYRCSYNKPDFANPTVQKKAVPVFTELSKY